MNTRRVALVDAFTTDPLSGNAAGVVPDAEGLSDAQMQAIASELAVSETAFVLPSARADRRLRFFTPTQEIPLCGHATVASHAYLFDDGGVDAGTHSLATEVGTLDVEVTEEGTVWMTQERPTVEDVHVDYARAGEALGIDPAAFEDVGADLPPAVASTGVPFLMLPVNFLEHLGNASPDFAAVEALADEYDATGVYVFTFDALGADSTLHARAFVPGAGIPEDPVTGTAAGACGAYLRDAGAFDTMPDELWVEQGNFVDRPGIVRVRVGADVEVGGRSVTSLDGSLVVPPEADDDIIEA